MTYVGPYSQATLIFEPEEELNSKVEVVATPGTLLDYIGRTSPGFLQIIRKANMLAFYNTVSQNKYTVFVPVQTKDYLMFDANTSRRICINSTVPGIITSDMLKSSQHLIVYNLANDGGCNNEMTISSENGNILINNNQNVLYGDILCLNGLVHVIDKILL